MAVSKIYWKTSFAFIWLSRQRSSNSGAKFKKYSIAQGVHSINRGFMQDPNIIETATIEKSHTRLCGAIKQIAVSHNFSFINVTKSIRLASSIEFMHGPLDWDHFNKRGYQVLSDELVGLFPHIEQGIRIDNCVY